jgi:hypothetical protein
MFLELNLSLFPVRQFNQQLDEQGLFDGDQSEPMSQSINGFLGLETAQQSVIGSLQEGTSMPPGIPKMSHEQLALAQSNW